MNKIISHFVREESGATAIEYGLIAALLSVAIITAVTAVGTNLGTTFDNLATQLGGTTTTTTSDGTE